MTKRDNVIRLLTEINLRREALENAPIWVAYSTLSVAATTLMGLVLMVASR